MQKVPTATLLLLAIAGCTQAPEYGPTLTQVDERVVADNPNCRDYTALATIDGVQQSITGRACQQPDGSWRVAESVPGQPTQTVTYWPPPYASYPYDEAWLWGPPLGFSLGTAVFVDHFHHLHHFDHFHQFAFDGMHHGLAAAVPTRSAPQPLLQTLQRLAQQRH